ncbi:MAG: response regulator, partial [Candidatus Hodarchaeales archaeon]
MLRVLFVDDDENFLVLAQKLLARQEPAFEIVTTPSPHDALQELTQKTSVPFSAVVADYQMPSMSGLELLENLRREGNAIPFIMFTGRGREEIAMQALNLGADHYLKKEGEPNALYAELAHIIKRLIDHKTTEEALKKSEYEKNLTEKKYRAIVEQSLIGIAILQDRGVIFANDAVCGLLEYSLEEILTWDITHISALIHPVDREFALTQFQQKLAGGFDTIPSYDVRLFAKSGKIKWVALHSKQIEIEGKTALLVTISDVTEQKNAEQLPAQSSTTPFEKAASRAEGKGQDYSHLFDASPISLWEADYSAVKDRIDNLRERGIPDFRKFLETHPREVA